VGQDTNTQQITIVLIGGGVGTYSLTFPTTGSHANVQFGGQIWDTLLQGGTGSVTITTQTATPRHGHVRLHRAAWTWEQLRPPDSSDQRRVRSRVLK
jgi:hypothetical protein